MASTQQQDDTATTVAWFAMIGTVFGFGIAGLSYVFVSAIWGDDKDDTVETEEERWARWQKWLEEDDARWAEYNERFSQWQDDYNSWDKDGRPGPEPPEPDQPHGSLGDRWRRHLYNAERARRAAADAARRAGQAARRARGRVRSWWDWFAARWDTGMRQAEEDRGEGQRWWWWQPRTKPARGETSTDREEPIDAEIIPDPQLGPAPRHEAPDVTATDDLWADRPQVVPLTKPDTGVQHPQPTGQHPTPVLPAGGTQSTTQIGEPDMATAIGGRSGGGLAPRAGGGVAVKGTTAAEVGVEQTKRLRREHDNVVRATQKLIDDLIVTTRTAARMSETALANMRSTQTLEAYDELVALYRAALMEMSQFAEALARLEREAIVRAEVANQADQAVDEVHDKRGGDARAHSRETPQAE